MQTFKTLASFWSCAGRIESHLVGNHADRFPRDEAHINFVLQRMQLEQKCLTPSLFFAMEKAVYTACIFFFKRSTCPAII